MSNEKQVDISVVIIGLVVAFVIAIVMTCGLALYQTLVAFLMYKWFLIPLGLPFIKFWHMYGVMLTLTAILPINQIVPKEINNTKTSYAIFFTPICILFLGWIVKSFLI